MKIIDISKHNGIIDFDKVKASGKVDGVMIRSSWGHFREDEQFKRNVSECERLNIPYGFYHYSNFFKCESCAPCNRMRYFTEEDTIIDMFFFTLLL
jgi:GH25 family lysozyme M1 (1,4-beta-N-acetylmuramidase)